MKFSLIRVFLVLVRVFFMLGFAVNQFAYTLIVGLGWPFKKFPIFGGCMLETQEYGWPLSFYKITTSCGLCCDGVGVPFSTFSFTNLITDVIYLLGLALFCFYIIKVILFLLKQTIILPRG